MKETNAQVPILFAGQGLGNAAALTEVGSALRNRLVMDTRRMKKIRWCGPITGAGAAGMVMRLQVSPDATTWTTVFTELIDSTGMHDPTPADLPAAFRIASCKIRLAAELGDGATSATSGIIVVHGSRR